MSIALALAGCGLENVPILSQPDSPLASGEVLPFRKIAANGDPIDEPGFRGYDIYYKFYASEIGIDIGIQSIDELRQKFHRLTEYESGVKPSPLISIGAADRTSVFYIAIDFSPALTELDRPRIYSLPGDPPADDISIFDFRRGVTYASSSETKRFAEFASTDADIDSAIYTIISTPNEKVTIAAYVVSYGVDADFGALFSIPLYLGYIQLDLPPY